jgi:uridine kinase
MMPAWKKNIFVRVVKRRMQDEGRTAEDIIQEYTKLTADEKADILAAI